MYVGQVERTPENWVQRLICWYHRKCRRWQEHMGKDGREDSILVTGTGENFNRWWWWW